MSGNGPGPGIGDGGKESAMGKHDAIPPGLGRERDTAWRVGNRVASHRGTLVTGYRHNWSKYRKRAPGDSAKLARMIPKLTHFAINTDDVEATQEFYAAVFGWKFQEYGPPGFMQILDESGTTPMGAIQQRRELLDGEVTRGFECSFGVDDVDAVREKIVGVGGKILMEKFTISNVGHLIAFEDPGGNPVIAMEYDDTAE